MEVILLGTNGWYDTTTGNTISILVKTSEYNIVFDGGNGIHKLDHYLICNGKTDLYLFLSHFHLDHIEGLHILCKFVLNKLKIFGPSGIKDILKTLVTPPFTVPFSDLRFKSEIHELPDELSEIPFKIKTLPLLHSSLTLGYRIEVEDKVITYCPDTGYCENAVKLAENADLLMAECSHKPGEYNEKWPHLNPETAGKIAKEAVAKKLKGVVITSSPFPIPKALTAKTRASVPEAQPTAFLIPR